MSQEVDILENELLRFYPDAFSELLKDHTTDQNIFWACDSYEDRGEGYGFFAPITIEKITGPDKHMVIRPRSVKQADEQMKRTKDKAEVFTPCWVCNAQNNLVDNAWFGKENIFNEEYVDEEGIHRWKQTDSPIVFARSGAKTWKKYVASVRMEITCGEAPYLVSRYDTTDGMPIPIEMRIGLLDRKFRIINEKVKTEKDWKEQCMIALKSIYGFEWQGDNLLIARENILYTVKDYFEAKFQKSPDVDFMKKAAEIVSWNIWQMDGLTFGLPGYTVKEREETPDSLFSSQDFEEDFLPQERLTKIMDWENGKAISFLSLITENQRP